MDTDWLRGNGDMLERIRAHDWSATALGAREHWPPSLRTAVMMILGHPLPMVLAWGPALVTLHNDASLDLLGPEPGALGRPLPEIWYEARDTLGPLLDRALAGEATRAEAVPFPLRRGGRTENASLDCSCTPVRDERGEVAGILVTAVENDMVLVERQLRESEQRFRALVTAGTYSIYRMSPDWRLMYQLDSHTLASTSGPIEDWVDKYILEEDRPEIFAAIDRAIRTRSLFELEHRVRLANEGVGWVLSRAVPLLDGAGEIVEWFGAGSDVTERRTAAERLRESEQRQRLTLELVPVLLWSADATGARITMTERWKTHTGQSDSDVQDFGWLEAVHPEDREDAREALRSAFASGRPLERQLRIQRVDDTHRWHLLRQVPVRDAHGRIASWFGAAIDVDELHGLQERQRVLVAELQHRTRNLMSVVRSMADMTLRASSDLSDFRARYRHRLEALSRVQNLLSRLEEHDRVVFDDLIRTELAALGGGSDRVTLSGPAGVRLRSSSVQALAMALHELATNALKYGGLGQASGRLAVTWSLEPAGAGGKPWLHIDWRESGVVMPPAEAVPHGTGHGRELIEQALPYQLGARVSYAFERDGVHCTIALPVSARTRERSQRV